MGIRRHKPEEIVIKSWQVEVLVGQGMLRIETVREVGRRTRAKDRFGTTTSLPISPRGYQIEIQRFDQPLVC